MRIRVSYGNCGKTPLLELLAVAKSSPAKRKAIYLYTQGLGFLCPDFEPDEYEREIVDEFRRSNADRIPIHTFARFADKNEWLKEIVEQSGGSTF